MIKKMFKRAKKKNVIIIVVRSIYIKCTLKIKI